MSTSRKKYALFGLIAIALFYLYHLSQKKLDLILFSAEGSVNGDFVFCNKNKLFYADGTNKGMKISSKVDVVFQHPKTSEFWFAKSVKDNVFTFATLSGTERSIKCLNEGRVIAWLLEPFGCIFDAKDGLSKHTQMHFINIDEGKSQLFQPELKSFIFPGSRSGDGTVFFYTSCNSYMPPWKRIPSKYSSGSKRLSGTGETKLYFYSGKQDKPKEVGTFEHRGHEYFRPHGPGPGKSVILRFGEQNKYMLVDYSGVRRTLDFALKSEPILSPDGKRMIYLTEADKMNRVINYAQWSAADGKYVSKIILKHLRGIPFRDLSVHWSKKSRRFCVAISTDVYVFDGEGNCANANNPYYALEVKGFLGERWLIVNFRLLQSGLIDLDGERHAYITTDGIDPPISGNVSSSYWFGSRNKGIKLPKF